MSASSAACTGVGPNRELGAAVSRAVINNHRKRGKLGGRSGSMVTQKLNSLGANSSRTRPIPLNFE